MLELSLIRLIEVVGEAAARITHGGRLLGSTGTWHQHLGAFQRALHFTTHGRPIGKTGRKNRERKATQGHGMIYVNKSIPVPHGPS